MIQSIKDLPMKDQKTEIDKKLVDWKGKQSQIDDILVLGFRYKQ